MFLRSLTIKGFKSFAEPTALEFEPGVTVVVGPNGSGKSNIVDAVAWVLGAQGPRTVRSSRMDDVIFAGSSRRPALGRAEVTLTIDNSARVLPIDFSEVTVTRTLFRSSGESEYALNGVTCRLIDIQELLSDTGVGRHQHVIVSQGNLDSVLEARPEERRLIIEEAAGILKYRRRKERARRRLEGTEANLVRLSDLLKEVRRQLRPLERQADAARRHEALAAELKALKVYLSGRELAGLAARAQGSAAERGAMLVREAALRTELADLDGRVAAAEAALSRLDAARLNDVAGRLDAFRERGRGLRALLVERQRSLEQQRAAAVDRGLIEALEADAARLSEELSEVEAAAAGLPPRFDEVARAEEELGAERAQLQGPSTVPVGAAEVRGELAALRNAVDRGRAEIAKLENQLSALDAHLAGSATALHALRFEVAELERAEQAAADSAASTEASRSATAAAVASARAAAQDAQREAHVWTARAEGLAHALNDFAATAGSGLLSEIEGVAGAVFQLVEVDPGWEVAFDAAVGDFLGAVAVDGVGTARVVLGALRASGVTATVLPPSEDHLPPAAGLPPGFPGGPLRPHVRSSVPTVARWLDSALAPVLVVDGDWSDALDMALAHPELVLVTREGDRFGPGGWRVGSRAGGSATTAAALDDARRRADEAFAREAAATTEKSQAETEHAAAELEHDRATAALDEARARRQQTLVRLGAAEAEARHTETEVAGLRSHVAQLTAAVAHESARIGELETLLPRLEEQEASQAREVEALRAARWRLEQRAEAVHSLRRELEVRAAGIDERRSFLRRRLEEIDDRLARAGADRDGARQRRERVESTLGHTVRLRRAVEQSLEGIESAWRGVTARRDRQARAASATSTLLRDLRQRRQHSERELEQARERARRAELEEAEARMRLEAAVESLRKELDCDPETAIAAPCPPLADGASAPSRVRELERELRLMGPINPLALEELSALEERHAFLSSQLDDVRATRRDLTKVIRAVDAEIVQLLAAAYADVADNFTRLFETLFPGGQGRLRLTDADNLLDTGIDIEARPLGKNVRKLSLLSGGERSLVALAFLFAVFRSRPSPFYLLDEVEAALDDVNLHRFLDLLDEFRQEAQLLVVSHQKRTMEAADSLYGVTMQPGGSSKVVSERLRTPA